MIKLDWIESTDEGWLAFDGIKEFLLPRNVIVSGTGKVEDFENRKVYQADMVIGFWRGVFDLDDFSHVSEDKNKVKRDKKGDAQVVFTILALIIFLFLLLVLL